MKAIVYDKYGPPEVLQLTDVDKPTPRDNEVLIKTYATTVHRGDATMRSFNIPGPRWQWVMAHLVLGIRGPRKPILGMELAGKIEAIGSKVTQFKVGDEVYASTVWADFGGYAEYKCMAEDGVLALKPVNMTFEEAAAVPSGGITTLGILKQANIRSGQTILIYGASGSVGTFAVQLARSFGAEVIGVCSTGNLEMVKSLGAVRVIDYTKEDFTQAGEEYDIVFDAVGKLPPKHSKQALKRSGTYLNVLTSSDAIKPRDAAGLLRELTTLIEAGRTSAFIDRCYSMEQIVEAHRYVDTGHKRGNVVVKIADGD